MWDVRDRRGDLLSGIKTIANTLSFPQTKQFLIAVSLVSRTLMFYFTFTKILQDAAYLLLVNNAAVIIIASLYQEDKEAFMRKISDQTILLATALFLSFSLIAYFSNLLHSRISPVNLAHKVSSAL